MEAKGRFGKSSNPLGVTWAAYSPYVQWPVLDTSAFGLKEQQRAHYVLAFILHYYAHSIPDDDMDKCSPIHIPKSLAKPLVAVSRALRIAPVLTYADTIIWNLELINPDGPTTPDNLQNETLFSETEDESAFYMSQVNCELRGAELLTCMQELSQMTAEDKDVVSGRPQLQSAPRLILRLPLT